MYKVTIPMRLPSYNEFIDAYKTHYGKWYKGNQLKQDFQQEVMLYLKKLPKIEKPVRIKFIWVSTKDDRRDPDNIDAGGRKIILDALQKAGKLKNDSRKYVSGGFIAEFEIGARYEVRLEIEELKTFELKECTEDEISNDN